MEKQVFLLKPKHQNHLSQLGECDYGAQSWRESRLLCESLFIPIQRQTSILKMVEREVFLMKPKPQNHLSQQGNVFIVPNQKRKEIIIWIHVYPNWKRNFDFKIGRRWSSRMKPTHQNCLSQQ